MENRTSNNIKLGGVVVAGLLILVSLLYMIGKNISLFGSTYVLKARFQNAQGLVTGNNVRFAGLQAGTVKEITILDDTTIEVAMFIEKKMSPVIRKNAVASIGTDGLVGNKVVNILPSRTTSLLAVEGDILLSAKKTDMDEMLQTLSKTNQDVAAIAGELRATARRLNENNAFWTLLSDKSIPLNLRMSLSNFRKASSEAEDMAKNLDGIISDIKEGKGSAGMILHDSALALNLENAVSRIGNAGASIDSLFTHATRMVDGLRRDVDTGAGPVHMLLRDTALVGNLQATIDNIRRGTDGFNQNMEALKHNFLLRGYFRMQEKAKEKEQKKAAGINKER